MRILITDGMDPCAVDALRTAGFDICEQHASPEELGIALQEFDCAIVRSETELRAIHIDEAMEGNLQLIIHADAGADSIFISYAENRGIAVRNVACSTDEEIVSIVKAFFITE